MDNFLIKASRKPKLRNPLLIEGLPGTGNVAKIAVDYLIEVLGAKKFMEIYSYTFPNSVFVAPDSTIKLPSIEFYYCKNKNRDLVLLVGDIQPIGEKESYELANKLLDVAKTMGIKEIVTLGGIGLQKEPSSPRVHAAVTSKEYRRKLKNIAILDGDKTFGFIVGAAGLLLGLGQLKGFKGIALLGETYAHPTHFGIKSSLAVLRALSLFLKMDLSLKNLEKEIKYAENKMKKKKSAKKNIEKVMKSFDGVRHRYIG